MKYTSIAIFISLLSYQCTNDSLIHDLSDSELSLLQSFRSIEAIHQMQVTTENEPGEKLWLCLTFTDKASNTPLPHQAIHLYHTSASGEYEPADPNDESTSRLNGSATTNAAGQVFVQTILPGAYGRSAGNMHIHTTVFDAQPANYDIHFKQYTRGMGLNFIEGSDQHFLADLKRTTDSTLVAFLTIAVKNPSLTPAPSPGALPACEWCGAAEAPDDITWQDTIADLQEAGERLILEGTIYQRDGITPANNVIVYAYHTNAQGIYAKKGDETGNGQRHGYLRGWTQTNENGQYRFSTVKPAPYPSHAEPAHIHMTLKGENFDEYWINSTWFEGDPMITEEMIAGLKRTGGFSNIVKLEKNTVGAWVGKRDIIIAPPED